MRQFSFTPISILVTCHSYKKFKKSSASDSVKTYTYYCAQNEDEVKKPHLHDETRKRRARMKMCRFPCKGTLQITIDDANLDLPLRLKLIHHQSHVEYVDISISKNIRDLVEGMKHESPSNVGFISFSGVPKLTIISRSGSGY